MTFKSHYTCVKEFMEAADQIDLAAEFKSGSLSQKEIDILKLRLKLITEEVSELFAAVLDKNSFSSVRVLNYFDDIQDIVEKLDQSEIKFDRLEVADAIADIDYINSGTAVAFHIPADIIFEEVHNNNMTKVDPNTGKCIKNEFGKILKPEGYTSVDLSKFI